MFVNLLPFPTKNELVIGVLEASIPEPVTYITEPDKVDTRYVRLPSISEMVSFDPLTALKINGMCLFYYKYYLFYVIS
jgi:hypothetical protein